MRKSASKTRLPRLLILNGTMGAGKSTVASAIRDLLTKRAIPNALIDADALCQAFPTDPGDPYNQSLLFENLQAIAPNYIGRGLIHIVVARVVEDAADRTQYAGAFQSDDVTIIRLDMPEPLRMSRLMAREPEGAWQEFARRRTIELEASIVGLNLDDAVVDNDVPPPEVAQRVLAILGWTAGPEPAS